MTQVAILDAEQASYLDKAPYLTGVRSHSSLSLINEILQTALIALISLSQRTKSPPRPSNVSFDCADISL